MSSTVISQIETRMLSVPYSTGYGSITLGADNKNAFKRRVMEYLDAGERDFVLDLRNAKYIDSSGLGVLVSLAKKIREADGTFVLLGPNEDLVTLFELTHLDTVLTVRTVEEWIRRGGSPT